MMADKTTPTTTPSSDGSATTGTQQVGQQEVPTTGHRRLPPIKADVKAIRTLVARVVWAVCVLFALILASAVLMIALDANRENDLVNFVLDRAGDVDLGFFALDNPIKDFDQDLGPDQDTRTALFNYGIGAIVWLVFGRLLDRVVRP